MKANISRLAYGLVAILIIAAILISIGQRETNAKPSAGSYNPSGLHAFQELLGRNGIRTRVDRLEQPQLKPNDLVIAAYVDEGPQIWGDNPLAPIDKSLKEHLKKGGRILVLPFDKDFRARSFTAVKATTPIVNKFDETVLQVNSAPLTFGSFSDYDGEVSTGSAQLLPFTFEDVTYSSWMKREVNSTDPFVAYASRGKGMIARTADGLFATNRFIDRNDNATIALQIVKGMVGEGGQVVFTEATLGAGISPSLVNILGPWATGIWIQLTVLFLVVVFTLGIRFGLPAVERRTQTGQREMIDAISDVYLRAKSTAVALSVAYDEADRRIRRNLKMPAHLSSQERDRHLPESLATTLAHVDKMRSPVIQTDSKGRQKVIYRLDPSDALELIRKLEEELDAFIPRSTNRIS